MNEDTIFEIIEDIEMSKVRRNSLENVFTKGRKWTKKDEHMIVEVISLEFS